MNYSVSPEDIVLIWVADYYDHPLSGICWYEGRMHSFEWGYGEDEVLITALGLLTKLRWRARQRLFELCVGYNWTYDEGKRPLNTKVKFGLLSQFYYRWGLSKILRPRIPPR